MTLRAFVKKNRRKSAESIARMAVRHPNMLMPTLIREVEHLLRELVHFEEHSVIVPFLSRVSKNGSSPLDVDVAVIEAFRNRVSIGNGIREEMLDLTVDQHRRRIELLQVQCDGLNDTIKMHNKCIETLQKSGVNTMRAYFQATGCGRMLEVA